MENIKLTALIKKFLIAMVVIILLAFDWAALHDIIKGELNLILEYVMVLFSLAVFGLLFFFRIRKRKQTVQTM